MYEIIVYGKASQKDVAKLPVQDSDLDTNLMDFLRENNLPIASSCLGKGQCSKCVINGFMLSCTVTMKEFLRISSQPLDARCGDSKFLVTIDYL